MGYGTVSTQDVEGDMEEVRLKRLAALEARSSGQKGTKTPAKEERVPKPQRDPQNEIASKMAGRASGGANKGKPTRYKSKFQRNVDMIQGFGKEDDTPVGADYSESQRAIRVQIDSKKKKSMEDSRGKAWETEEEKAARLGWAAAAEERMKKGKAKDMASEKRTKNLDRLFSETKE